MTSASTALVVVDPDDRSPDEWADYCNEARGQAASAILEWGRRIEQAHRAYKAQGQRWGRRWDDWCREQLGMSRTAASRLQAIAENFDHDVVAFLPVDQQALHSLARLRRDHPQAFDEALASGAIHVDMGRKAASELLERHSQPTRLLALPTTDIPAVEGSVWQLGRHRLYCCDSTHWRPSGPVRLAIADPPWGVGIADWDEQLAWQHDWLADVAQVVAVMPGKVNLKAFQPQMPYRTALSFWISNSMRHGPVGFDNCEIIEIYSHCSSIRVGASDFSQGAITGRDRNHPAQKPAALMEWLIQLFTDEGDTVIDPFAGSGSSLLACETTGRSCIAVEREPAYCQQIVAAWEQQTGQQAIALGVNQIH